MPTVRPLVLVVTMAAALSSCQSPEVRKRARQEDPAESEWRQIVKKTSPDLFRSFAAKYPDHPRAAKAKLKARELAWLQAKATDSPSAYRAFLEAYPLTNRKHQIDARLSELEKTALVRAAENGDPKAVARLLPEATVELKAKALMMAVFGALHTSMKAKFTNGQLQTSTVRTKSVPRGTYVQIIQSLVSKGADPSLYKYEDFRSITVLEDRRQKEMRRQIEATGRGEATFSFGKGDRNVKLVPAQLDGMTVFEVARIHEAKDILAILQNRE